MINDILSAVSPQSARYIWNTVTQAVMAPIQMAEPTIDRITSETQSTIFVSMNKTPQCTL